MKSFIFPSTPVDTTGLATEATLSSVDGFVSSIDAKIPSIGQADSANSSPVVLATDQSSIPVTITDGAGTANTKQIGTAVTNSDVGLITQSVIHGLSSGGGGTYVDVKVTPSGSLTTAIGDITGITGQATMAGSVPVVIASNQSVVPVSASSLPLPTGAATETTLAALNAKVTAVNTGAVTVSSSALPTGASTEATLSALNAKVTAVDTGAVTISSSALPTGASTETTLAALNAKVTAVNTGAVTVSSSALPTGAATETTLSALNTKMPSQGQAAMAASVPVVIASNQTSLPFAEAGLSKANNPVYNSYSSTSVTTSAYVQVIASTTSAAKRVQIFDSSGQAMILAVGGSGSEVDQVYIPPGGADFQLAIPASSRVSLKALTATANSGYIIINLLG